MLRDGTPRGHNGVFFKAAAERKSYSSHLPINRFRICARLNGPDGQHAVLVLCFFSPGNNVVMLFLLLILLLLMLRWTWLFCLLWFDAGGGAGGSDEA